MAMVSVDFLNSEHARALDEMAVVNPLVPYRTEKRNLSTRDGGLGLLGKKFRSDWMRDFPGLIVEVRFDPRRLDEGVDVYTVRGRLLGRAECQGRRYGPEALQRIGGA